MSNSTSHIKAPFLSFSSCLIPSRNHIYPLKVVIHHTSEKKETSVAEVHYVQDWVLNGEKVQCFFLLFAFFWRVNVQSELLYSMVISALLQAAWRTCSVTTMTHMPELLDGVHRSCNKRPSQSDSNCPFLHLIHNTSRDVEVPRRAIIMKLIRQLISYRQMNGIQRKQNPEMGTLRY